MMEVDHDSAVRLHDVLEDRAEITDREVLDEEPPLGMNHVEEGMCIECEDQPASLECQVCEEDYCDVCFKAQHRKGKRLLHKSKAIDNPLLQQMRANMQVTTTPTLTRKEIEDKAAELEAEEQRKAITRAAPAPAVADSDSEKEEDEYDNGQGSVAFDTAGDNYNSRFSLYGLGSLSSYFSPSSTISLASATTGSVAKPTPSAPRRNAVGEWMLERSKYIPLRLSLKERKMLRLLEAALAVSEYTDKIDIISFKNKAQRINTQIKDICAILTGLVVASDYKTGKELVREPSFKENAKFFQNIFEVGRRHKIMNPEKMRTEYGKLMYLLQDSVSPVIQEMLEFSCIRPLRTVHSYLEERDAAQLLADDNIMAATAEVVADPLKRRADVQREIKTKERAIELISRKYASDKISPDDIKMCLYSIGDNNSFLTFNRDPIDRMIDFLTTMFKPEQVEEGYSLAIRGGMDGARLSHNHSRQYYYVLQSLTLWREIANDMFKLWVLAETDLLDEGCQYRLKDTGQGLNRVQPASRIGRAMHGILHHTQCKVGNWVGSSVIHLGDNNVPNALMFIDKYTQVARILNPIVLTIQELDVMVKNPGIADYINNAFDGVATLKKDILVDFFRHAFDGSGADNFFDAGSCIDGRLTSAWNWCSRLEKKHYYPVFKLAGFNGFDGDFQK